MALSSMTGFARAEGVTGAAVWAWEIKSVNSKGLDVKLRLPGSLEAAEPQIRQAIAAAVSRGSVFASLSVKREGATSEVRINEVVLAQVVEAARLVAEKLDARAPAIDGLLAIKGVIDVVEAEETEEERAALIAAILAGLDTALARLVAMRREEGRALEACSIAASTRSPPSRPRPRTIPAAARRRSAPASPSRSRPCWSPAATSIRTACIRRR